MELNDEQKLNYLIAAGGKHCADKEYTPVPVFGSWKDAEAFGRLPQEEQQRILSDTAAGSEPADAVSVYGKENLVKISMPDDGMYPNLWTGDELTIAFREEVRDGELAAVTISGTNLPVTVREVSYDRDNIWLIPRNESFPVDCCSPDKVRILGKLVAMSRDLLDSPRWNMD